KFTDARFDLASVEAESSQWEAAARDFKRVITERPDDEKASQHLGEVLFMWGDQLEQANDHAQAARRYQEALIYRAKDPELHMSLGVALARAGHLQQARSEFEAALDINPQFEPARQALLTLRAEAK
ncbi:MAG: tetratricopeptide repeat protein, partial [Acidobacteriaceae bacterium]|nr:tetratricopeptide repeat protein [Acidobacteriaceae bacterium]